MSTPQSYTLITGGTSGIGYELARLFAKDGNNLVLVARGQEGLDNAAAELKATYGVEVVTISKDLFDPQNAFSLYEEVTAQGIVVHTLVNDAGQGLYGEFKDTDLQRELDIIQLNISSLVVLTKLFLQDMLVRGEGRILNLSSIAGKVPGPWQSVYHGTKAFVQSFTEAIRSELRGTNIVVTALLPGATDTDFFNKAEMTESKQVQAGNLADPAKVAADGYDALQHNEDKVISGFKNKVQIAMSNITPDSTVADMMYKQQEPAGKS